MTIKEVSEKYGISQDTLRYYERIGVIPEVTRTAGGIRDYQEKDVKWVELAVCMRNAGLPIESLIEYQRLYQIGDSTIQARLELLNGQMDVLKEQKKQIEETMARLAYKISRYEEALKTGKLTWKSRGKYDFRWKINTNIRSILFLIIVGNKLIKGEKNE